MALLRPRDLRALALEALGEAGARGFMRFLPEGREALLLTDAPRFLASGARRERLLAALRARGFSPLPEEGGLLPLLPGDALLLSMAKAPPVPAWDWDGTLAEAFSLADRWLRAPDASLSPQGRRLAVETARLLWRREDAVLAGLARLRAAGARAQRERAGGLRVAGGMLLSWCEERGSEPRENSCDERTTRRKERNED